MTLPRAAFSCSSLHSHQIGTLDSAPSADSAFEPAAPAAPDAEVMSKPRSAKLGMDVQASRDVCSYACLSINAKTVM